MNSKINKSKLNLSIDIVMFIFLMAVSGAGFLIKYVLIPGFKRNDVYGKDVELYFWGLDRHQWGSIHLYLSFGLLILLFLHIIFHWKQIVSIFKRMIPSKGMRVAFTGLFVIISFVFGILPLFVNPEVQQGVSHHGNHSFFQESVEDPLENSIDPVKLTIAKPSQAIDDNSSVKYTDQSKNEQTKSNNHERNSEVEIYGYMSLDDVSAKFNIPVNELVQCIDIPEGHTSEKLGRLRKQFDFKLSDLRAYIEKKL